MTDVAPPLHPRSIPNLPPPRTHHLQIPIPASSRTFDQNGRIGQDTFSPVTQYGSFEFDRIIKAGELLKRTRKTKKWKPIYIVLRPNVLSIYRDKQESKLRHQINLSELTAITKQRDPKNKDRHMFGLFSPSRNFHLEASSAREAQEWIDVIRKEAKIDEDDEEMYIGSPVNSFMNADNFGRSIDANLSQSAHDRMAAGYSSSDAEAFQFIPPRRRDRGGSTLSNSARRLSQVPLEYSGADHGSMSDFSDSLGAARMSSLSLANTDPRPSTSSFNPSQPSSTIPNSPYGAARPSLGTRNPSQLSTYLSTTTTSPTDDAPPRPTTTTTATSNNPANPTDPERVICQGWIHLLKSTSGVRQWKRVWMVLRPKVLAIYKTDDEYSASLVLPFATIVDVVEIDPISRSKTACLQVITEERNYRLAAMDEEGLARWLGAFKSLLSKRKLKGS